MKFFLLAISFFFFSLTSWAVGGTGVTKLTLSESIDVAMKKNPNILMARQDVRGAEGRMLESISPMIPQIGTNFSYLYYHDYPYANFNTNWEIGGFVNQNLFTGGKLFNRARAANEELKIANEGDRLTRQQIVFKVTQAFYEVLFTKRVVAIDEETLKLAEEDYEITKARYEKGESSDYDLLRTEVQVVAQKPRLIEAKNRLETSLNNFKLLLSMDPLEEVELDGDFVFSPFQEDFSPLIEEAKGKRPEIKQSQSSKKASRYLSWAAIAGYIPDISFNFTDYTAQRYAFSQFLPRDSWDGYWMAKFNISIPVFDGLAREAKIKEADAKRLKANISDRLTLDQVTVEVENSYLTVKNAEELVLSQRRNVERANEAYKIIWERYVQGKATQLDILDAQVALSQAKLDHARSLYAHIVSKAKLVLALGR